MHKVTLRLSLLNLDFPPEVTQSTLITETASHHVVALTETPHNTAHMRQHGKFENFDVWNRDFLTFCAKIWCFSDLYKIYDFQWKYQQKTVFAVSLMIPERFLINSGKYQKLWKICHVESMLPDTVSDCFHSNNSNLIFILRYFIDLTYV